MIEVPFENSRFLVGAAGVEGILPRATIKISENALLIPSILTAAT